MRWGFTLLGQPPSWNDMYEIVTRHRGDRVYSSLAKKATVSMYQDDCIPVIRSARPSRWAPEGDIVLLFWFHLTRTIDIDNLQKAINDAIKVAVGVDDKWFLTYPIKRTVGVTMREAKVEVVVLDGPEASAWLSAVADLSGAIQSGSCR